MEWLVQDLKRQASFFLREKIKTARLVLTDVTPVQLLTEEVTNGDSLAPDAHAMRLISRAAFEVDDYDRIVHILHLRLSKFEAWNWRASYNGVVVLEHLLTHGPQRIADEFQTDQQTIQDMTTFHYVDHNGFNWGMSVQMKSERVMKLLGDMAYLKEERAKARKITLGIKGFGSFSQQTTTIVDGTSYDRQNPDRFFRSKSLFLESKVSASDDQFTKLIKTNKKAEDADLKSCSHTYNSHHDEYVKEDDHPFWDKDQQTRVSLLTSI